MLSTRHSRAFRDLGADADRKAAPALVEAAVHPISGDGRAVGQTQRTLAVGAVVPEAALVALAVGEDANAGSLEHRALEVALVAIALAREIDAVTGARVVLELAVVALAA